MLRSLSLQIKATFFYFIFFLLLILAVLLSEMAVANVAQQSLVIPDKNFILEWENYLKTAGYVSDKDNKAEIDLKKSSFIGWQLEVNTIHSQLSLPESESLIILQELGKSWRKITRSAGFELKREQWGYQEQHIWLKISAQVFWRLKERQFQRVDWELTLIQPVSKELLKNGSLIVPPYLGVQADEVADELNSASSPVTLTEEIPQVAIVIDDVGIVRKPADQMLLIPAPLTWALMPFNRLTKYYLQAAQERGFETILHLPLESIDEKLDPGFGVLKREWSEEKIRAKLDEDLQNVPGITGVNNHMGSAGTADERLMRILMQELKRRDLFFLDSLTTKNSVAGKYALKFGVAYLKRDVFLDNESSLDSKKANLRKLLELALEKGQAIGIGHVREGTAEAILEMLPEFKAAGVKIVPLSQLLLEGKD